MPTILILGLVFLGLLLVLGAVVTFVAARKARDGFEDEEGFHSTEAPKD